MSIHHPRIILFRVGIALCGTKHLVLLPIQRSVSPTTPKNTRRQQCHPNPKSKIDLVRRLACTIVYRVTGRYAQPETIKFYAVVCPKNAQLDAATIFLTRVSAHVFVCVMLCIVNALIKQLSCMLCVVLCAR